MILFDASRRPPRNHPSPLPIPLFYGFNKFPIPKIQWTADVWSNRNDKTKAVLKYTYNKVYIMQ